MDVQRHLAWLLKRSHPDKELKARLFAARTLEQVELLLRELGLAVRCGEAPGQVAGPLDSQHITDPKQKKRVAKKERRAERKAQDKKRAREEKKALLEDESLKKNKAD